MTESYHAAC